MVPPKVPPATSTITFKLWETHFASSADHCRRARGLLLPLVLDTVKGSVAGLSIVALIAMTFIVVSCMPNLSEIYHRKSN